MGRKARLSELLDAADAAIAEEITKVLEDATAEIPAEPDIPKLLGPSWSDVLHAGAKAAPAPPATDYAQRIEEAAAFRRAEQRAEEGTRSATTTTTSPPGPGPRGPPAAVVEEKLRRLEAAERGSPASTSGVKPGDRVHYAGGTWTIADVRADGKVATLRS